MLINAAAEARVVLCTSPDHETAARIAHGLVDARLAACVNIVPQIRSIYRWQQAVHDEFETLMIIKTTLSACGTVEAWLQEHHPYDVPEVLSIAVDCGADNYLAWLKGQVV